jgi:hypothetical protein
MKKAKAKESTTKKMADDAYKKQKEKQKKYYDKKTESKRVSNEMEVRRTSRL